MPRNKLFCTYFRNQTVKRGAGRALMAVFCILVALMIALGAAASTFLPVYAAEYTAYDRSAIEDYGVRLFGEQLHRPELFRHLPVLVQSNGAGDQHARGRERGQHGNLLQCGGRANDLRERGDHRAGSYGQLSVLQVQDCGQQNGVRTRTRICPGT